MFNTKIKVMISLAVILNMMGCGGAGGESEQIVDNLEPEINSVVDQNGEDTGIAMSELIANEGFSFTNKQQVSVALDLNDLLDLKNQTEQRAYISVYGEYQLLNSGRYYPVASSRLLGGDLENGLFNHTFVSLNNQPSYLIEVWFYNGEQSIQKLQSLVDNTLTW